MKLTALIVALATLAVISHSDGRTAVAANVTVNVGDQWFCNSTYFGGVCPTVIRPGDTVTWNWVGSLPHNTTSCTDGTFSNCTGAGGWVSPTQSSGTFVRAFPSTGTFFYRCNVHPTTMRGRIDVIQDSDGDGWSDGAETVIGTNPNAACGANAWPADINNSGFADTADIAMLTNDFGNAVPAEASARHDLAPDPPLAPPNAHVDTADIARLTGLFGRGCAP